MQDMTETNIPETIEYNETYTQNLSKRQALVEGWMRGVVKSVQKKVSKNNNLMLQLTIAPLDENDTVCSPTGVMNLFPPIPNPSVAAHTAPNTSLGCWFFAKTIDPKFPSYPKKREPGVYVTDTGETMDKAGYDKVRYEIDDQVIKTAIAWWNSPDMLVDEVFYFQVKHNQGSDGNTYANIERTRGTAPDGEVVITSGFGTVI